MPRDVAALTADFLLSISDDEPERVFSEEADVAKKEMRKLAFAWHPDRNEDSQAGAVFHKVQVLYARAEQKRAAGTWEVPGQLTIKAANGSVFTLSYARRHAVDIGSLYVGRSVFAFEVGSANLDLVDEGLAQQGMLTYADSAMEAEFSKYFPQLVRKVETHTGAVLVYQKNQGQLLLKDVLEHFNGKMPPRHVAWLISRLLNIACYLERQAKLSHNGIGVDTVFISPELHSVALTGWWFAAGQGEPLKALSRNAAMYAPPDVLTAKQGNSRTDIELIKALGRQLLGDASGARLRGDASIPAAMVDWLELSTAQDAVSAFKEWQNRVLLDAFGQRRFEELALTFTDIYS